MITIVKLVALTTVNALDKSPLFLVLVLVLALPYGFNGLYSYIFTLRHYVHSNLLRLIIRTGSSDPPDVIAST